MSERAVSKVTLNGTTLIDVTQDTVAANNLLTGNTATGADGEKVAGALTIPTFTTQEKSVSPSESEQVVTPDSGKDGLSKVTVGAISSTYVGSGIAKNPTPTASGKTVTIPAGYYDKQTTKDVGTTTHPNPTVSINSATGIVTASHTQTAGYVSAGTTEKTLALTTKAAATITPSETAQEIAAGQYLTGKQTIAAIPSDYVGSGITVDPTPTASGKTVTIPAGYYSEQTTKDVATAEQATPSVSIDSAGKITATATQTAGYVAAGTKTGTKQLTTKAATTINTSTSDQTIASGTYLTGTQTIKAVTTSNIDAGNIKDGVTVKVGDANSAGRIKNVTGTFTDSSTVSSGQTAAAAGQMLSGYSAWVDGAEVKGSIATKAASDLTASGKTVTVPAGYYAAQATKDVASGSATTPATTITANPTITVNTTTGEITATTSASKSVTPAVSAGYVSAGTAGTVTVNGSGISQIDVYEGEIGEGSSDPGGGGSETAASQKDVNFIDYDGTIRYSYTASEFANLTALPANPSHSGLTAQGWNWSLADAKAYVAKYGKLCIGQMYITDDGKTRVYIHLEEGRTSPMLGCCPNGTVVVDWGDGSATETLTGTSLSTVKWTNTHNYASAGDYVITLNVTSGTMMLSGTDNNNLYANLLRYASTADSRNRSYQRAVRRVEIGENTRIGAYALKSCSNLNSVTVPLGITVINPDAFYNCNLLSSATIPTGVTSIGNNAFYACNNLENVSIPSSVTSIGSQAFYYTQFRLSHVALADGVASIGNRTFYISKYLVGITIPNSVTTIGMEAFYSCESLMRITIPSGVTSVASGAFQNCYNLVKIRFEPTTPPTVANSNAWSSIPTDCVISVPTGTLSAYTSATNYPSSSTYTYIEE